MKIRPGVFFETKDGFFGEIRTMTANRRLTLRLQDPEWEKPSVVEFLLVPRPDKKCILVFNHSGIPDADSLVTLRKRWRNAADSAAGDSK